ncbi:hypothetical protein KDD17_06905 [Sulfitobacter albidus]|uniref:Uncharacterized protein n=1 Tax=Sulfitobacter albidus TaxID=2829501 RepID=A0A975JGC0_9RHOB|nr:hypothetical protein [Sulfitobacter albidus]QUJ77681.1 hypothetical protein KDD17_06905 [Sulfitobacter albidus]
MRSLVFLGAICAGPAMAATIDCTFTVECIESECAETAFSLSVEDFDPDGGR